MSKTAICATLIVLLCATGYCAELQQAATPLSLEITLTPGSSKALVRDVRSATISEPNTVVEFSWAGAKVDPASLQIVPPEGVTVVRTSQAADQKDTVIWELVGQSAANAKTILVYQLDGIQWSPHYTLAYTNSRDEASQGLASLQATVDITNDSGLDLQNAHFTLELETDEGAMLQVGNGPVSLPLKWTKRLPLRGVDGSPDLLAQLPAWTRCVYNARLYGNDVHNLLYVGTEPVSTQCRRLQALPEGPLDVMMPGSGDMADALPAVSTTWKRNPALTRISDELACLSIDMGIVQTVTARERLLEFRRKKIAFDDLGHVSGSDVIERRALELVNMGSEVAGIDVYWEILKTWELVSDLPRPSASTGEKAVPIWSGSVPAHGSATMGFTITKHEGTNAK